MRSPVVVRPWLALALALGACRDPEPAPPADGGTLDAQPADTGASDAAPLDARADTELPPVASDAGDSGPGILDATHADTAAPPATDATTTPDSQPLDASSQDAAARPSARRFVYVGGYDWGNPSYPFRGFALDGASFSLTPLEGIPSVGANPSFVTPNPTGTRLYVANEGAIGGVSVAAVDPASGGLSLIDHEEDFDDSGYVFTELSPDGRFVLATSYSGGYAGVYPVQEDGSLEPARQRFDFGDGSHPHSVRVHPAGVFTFVPTLGLDAVAQLRLEPATGELSFNAVGGSPSYHPAPTGPRHIALSNDGAFAFVIEEKSDDVRSMGVDESGRLFAIDAVPRLPAGFVGEDRGAHILLHPNQRFLYCSNRGSDTLTAFAVAADGSLTLIEHEPTGGATPRNFDIDDAGEVLIVANTGTGDSDGSVHVFAIETDGSLTPVGTPVTGLPQPASVAIVSYAE